MVDNRTAPYALLLLRVSLGVMFIASAPGFLFGPGRGSVPTSAGPPSHSQAGHRQTPPSDVLTEQGGVAVEIERPALVVADAVADRLPAWAMPIDVAMKKSRDIYLNELQSLEDVQEGIRAVLEKRKPVWKNK